jgi:hypothetical protein
MQKHVFYFNVTTFESTWKSPEASSSAVVFQPSFPAASGDQWCRLREISAERRCFSDRMAEVEHSETTTLFYLDTRLHEQEQAARRLQQWQRKRCCRRPPQTWTSEAFSFEKPVAFLEAERVLAGWLLVKRRSRHERSLRDVDENEWEEFVDPVCGGHFFCRGSREFTWHRPRVMLPSQKKLNQRKLMVSEAVYAKLPGEENETKCIVVRVRTHKDGWTLHYDVTAEDGKSTLRWLGRDALRQLPRSREELQLAKLQEQWTTKIRSVRAAEKRRKERALAANAETQGAKRQGVRLTVARLSAACVAEQRDLANAARIKYEMELVRSMLDADAAAAAAADAALVGQISQQLSAAPCIDPGATKRCADAELAIQLEREKCRLRREREATMAHKRLALQQQQRSDVIARLEEVESRMTTPRSKLRRNLLRQLHLGVLRQEDGYVICDWGCREWVKLGEEQKEHQLNDCTKRLLPCNLRCDLCMPAEEWLQQLEHAPAPKTRRDWHEEAECECRMVLCTRRCGEWVQMRFRQQHIDALCVKRPAEPILCRLGCGESFGGEILFMIKAEEDRLEHEREWCPARETRCAWPGCTAVVYAKDRNAHRERHLQALGISTYTVAGRHTFQVPSKVGRLEAVDALFKIARRYRCTSSSCRCGEQEGEEDISRCHRAHATHRATRIAIAYVR